MLDRLPAWSPPFPTHFHTLWGTLFYTGGLLENKALKWPHICKLPEETRPLPLSSLSPPRIPASPPPQQPPGRPSARAPASPTRGDQRQPSAPSLACPSPTEPIRELLVGKAYLTAHGRAFPPAAPYGSRKQSHWRAKARGCPRTRRSWVTGSGVGVLLHGSPLHMNISHKSRPQRSAGMMTTGLRAWWTEQELRGQETLGSSHFQAV